MAEWALLDNWKATSEAWVYSVHGVCECGAGILATSLPVHVNCAVGTRATGGVRSMYETCDTRDVRKKDLLATAAF